MKSISRNANAKINLTLDITGRRADGYHSMRMVMQEITLCDRVTLSETCEPGIRVTCGNSPIPCDRENTAVCAAEAFFARSGIADPHISLSIEKQIPFQAGLGGGSADAAAALRLLNEAYRTGYTEEELCAIGLKIGADVPFCIVGGTALAQGVGEKLSSLPAMPDCFLVVCRPDVGVSTPRAFADFDSCGVGSTDYTGRMIEALVSGSLTEIAHCLGNVFEKIPLPEQILSLKQRMLEAGALGACMTGSGSAVFGIFSDLHLAQSLQAELETRFSGRAFICRSVRK